MSHDIERRGMLQGLTAGIVASAVPGRVAAQSPTVLETREIRGDDGTPLNLVTAGQSGGRSILFLHGFSQSYMSFLPQLTDRELGDGFRLAAFDLRGHGASGKPWTSAAYLESRRWAEDIAAVMRAARLDRPLVVAWSFGGYCALDYIRHFGTSELGGLLLVGSNAGLLPRPPGAGAIATNDLQTQIADAETFMRLMSAKPLPLDAVMRGRAAYLMCPPYVRRAMLGRNLDNSELAARLQLPFRIILGGHDPLARPEQLKALRVKAPQAVINLYADCGHSPFLEDVKRFNAEVLAFANTL